MNKYGKLKIDNVFYFIMIEDLFDNYTSFYYLYQDGRMWLRGYHRKIAHYETVRRIHRITDIEFF